MTARVLIHFVLLQPLSTRTSRRSSRSIGSKSQLCNEMWTILKVHTGGLRVACQIVKLTTKTRGNPVKRTCKSCKLLGNMCQTCCRYVDLLVKSVNVTDMYNVLCCPYVLVGCRLQYVSLNVRGIRKVLNNLDRISSPQKPKDGCMALQVERPHHPGSTTFQVGANSAPLVWCVPWHSLLGP